MDKEQEAFDEWCKSVEDCGFIVQPHSATARQRKLGWQARAALDMSEELATCLEALRSDEVRWHSAAQVNEFIDEALNKYRERKI